MGEGEAMGVELAAAIGQVREQLSQAIKAGKQSDVAFHAGPIEMEFQVAFTASGGGHGEVKVWVVSVGGKADVARGTTSRLKVSLTPVTRTGEVVEIGSVGDR